jgi:hypothetical protein
MPMPMPAFLEMVDVVFVAEERGAVSMDGDGELGELVDDDGEESSIGTAEGSLVGNGVMNTVMEVVVVGWSDVEDGFSSVNAVVMGRSVGVALVGRASGMPGGAGSVFGGSGNALATLEGCSKGIAAEVAEAGEDVSVAEAMYCAIPGTVLVAVDMTVTVVGVADEKTSTSLICPSCGAAP